MKLNYFSFIFVLFSLLFARYNSYYEQLEKKILNLNPQITMRRYLKEAANAKQRGGFLFPDLVGESMIMSDSYKITLSQMIPFPTKVIARSKQLSKEYNTISAGYETVQSEVKSVFKFSYINLYFLTKKLVILKENFAIIKQMESQIESQVVSGQVTTSKLLFIQIEKEKMMDSIFRTETKIRNSLKEVITIFDNKINGDKILSTIDKTDIKEYTIDFSKDKLNELIRNSAILKKYIGEKEQLKYIKQLKYNKFLPNFMVESSYLKMNNNVSGFDENLQFMVSLQIPLLGFTRVGELSEVDKKYQAKSFAVKNVRNILEKNIRVTIEDYNMNKNSYNRYRTTLKSSAEQNFREVGSRYSSANLSSVEYLEAFRRVLDIELMTLKYQVEMEKNIIKLEQLTTTSINNIIEE